MKHRYMWAVGYGAALALFTGYVMLDTFVISTVGNADASAINTEMFDEIDKVQSNAASADTETEDEVKKDSSGRALPHPTMPDKPTVPKNKSSSDSSTASESSGASEETTAPVDAVSGATIDENGTDADTKSSDRPSRPSWSDSNTENRKRPPSGNHTHGSGSDTKKESSGNSSSKTLTTSESSDGKSYSDENISINISEYYENDTRIYVADVKLSSAKYLKTAFAQDSYGKNITATTSETAGAKNAIFAVNGDYYGARESGYVIRNGVIYRSTGSSDTDVLCIYADGHFGITNSSEKTTEELLSEGVWQAFSFGPALVENGTVTVGKNDEVGKAKASNPRTAIGIVDDLHYIFVVADGRTSESAGLSLSQLAEFMKKLGATIAYNLDGGGSSTMYFDGKVLNNPTTSGSSINERKVSDIVYIG